ncbi:hypothetical protein JCM6882_008630 [Rhodosporidiobolus microsporus]
MSTGGPPRPDNLRPFRVRPDTHTSLSLPPVPRYRKDLAQLVDQNDEVEQLLRVAAAKYRIASCSATKEDSRVGISRARVTE